MAIDFFRLVNQKTDNRAVHVANYVYSDILQSSFTGREQIICSSKAHKLKIKFFFDAYRVIKNGVSQVYRVGRYYELEDQQVAYNYNTDRFLQFKYNCTEGEDGNFTWSIDNLNDAEITFYISSVQFQDSFYNDSLGWSNSDNPSNINSEVVTEIMPGSDTIARVNRNLTVGEKFDYSWGDFSIGITRNNTGGLFTVEFRENSTPQKSWAFSGNQTYNGNNQTTYSGNVNSGSSTIANNIGNGNLNTNRFIMSVYNGDSAYNTILWTTKNSGNINLTVLRN